MGRVWATVWRTGVKYVETDGEQYAASFAYYALFSLLPLLVLLITAGTRFLGNREQATTQIFELLSQYIVDLGSAETVGNGSALFAPARGKSRIFRRLEPVGAPARVGFPAAVGGPTSAQFRTVQIRS
jgi:hypothetical protein